jgi:small subunit ribosomal protein S4e
MSASHKKRLAMPRSWALPRKTTVWITKPRPCGHPIELCMPLAVILRDVLGLAQNRREVKRMLSTRAILVDGRVETDHLRGVGLMDVLTVGEDHFRCIIDANGKLRYLSINAKEAASKVCRIDGKTTVAGGVTQYNLHDGRNILLDDANAYKTGDSLRINLPDQEIEGHIAFESGATAYLIGGAHVGTLWKVNERIEKKSTMQNEVSFEEFGTVERNVFVVGDAPLPGIEVSA